MSSPVVLIPAISAKYKTVALAVGTVLFAGGVFVPKPYDAYVAFVGSVCLFIAGYGLRLPTWAVGRPILPATMLPLALNAKDLLEQYAHLLPGNLQGYANIALGLLALAVGAALPEPLKPVLAESAPQPAGDAPVLGASPSGTVVVAVAGECSLGQAAQGCKP